MGMKNNFASVAGSYLLSRDVSEQYMRGVVRTATKMDAAGLSLGNVTPKRLSHWLQSMKVSSSTKSNHRRMALTLLKHCLTPRRFNDLIVALPVVKQKKKIPIAWSIEELDRLLDVTLSLPGQFQTSRCSVKLWFTAWVMLSYETGLRHGDVYALEETQLRGDRLFVVQNKTGKPIGKRLTPGCVELLEQLAYQSTDGTLFRWAINRRNSYVRWVKILNEAGLKGSPKYLRRSGATYCEAANPGSATAFLGHASPEMAAAHYIDPTLLPDRTPQPPPLIIKESVEDC